MHKIEGVKNCVLYYFFCGMEELKDKMNFKYKNEKNIRNKMKQ